MPEIPAVPLTLEGAWCLHQMFRLHRDKWHSLDGGERGRVAGEAEALLSKLEIGSTDGHPNQTALYSMIGHKGDVLLLHFRDSLEDLHRTELRLTQLQLARYLEPVHSYVSVVELGLYDSSAKAYGSLSDNGVEPHSPEWHVGIAEVIARQTAAMAPRLWPAIPDARFLCFYPMDRKRGEKKNWYQETMADRQRMMHEHGLIGRRYADCVRQIITGSIGFDDWEWGVDLFADNPLVFKKLIYEMRFDEVSAVYALFGTFYLGVRVPATNLRGVLAGNL